MNKNGLNVEYSLKNFTELTEEEKAQVLSWRNSDRIRFKMINQEIISKESHWQWLEGLKNRRDCLYFLVYIAGKARGVIDFTDIDFEKKEAFGGSYIGRKEDIGLGLVQSQLLNQYFFLEMKMEVLKALVLKTNRRVYLYNVNIGGMMDCPEGSDDKFYCLYLSRERWLEQQVGQNTFENLL